MKNKMLAALLALALIIAGIAPSALALNDAAAGINSFVLPENEETTEQPNPEPPPEPPEEFPDEVMSFYNKLMNDCVDFDTLMALIEDSEYTAGQLEDFFNKVKALGAPEPEAAPEAAHEPEASLRAAEANLYDSLAAHLHEICLPFYELLLNSYSLDYYFELSGDYSEPQLYVFREGFSEAELAALDSHVQELITNYVYPVDFTNAAPLVKYFPGTPEKGGMGALADDDPLKLSKIVTDNGNGTYTVEKGGMSALAEDNHLKLSKVVTDNDNGTYTVHLEAYTTGEITTGKTPCDIVLVLDQSGSMTGNFGSGTRLDALKQAVNTFIDSIHTAALGEDGELGTDDDVYHRVAVVGFADGKKGFPLENASYTNTELFDGAVQIRYDSLDASHYAAALKDMRSDGYNTVQASVGALDADGKTFSDLGIEMAKNVLDNAPSTSDAIRNKVVIVFTDGRPGNFTYWQSDPAGDSYTVAVSAIQNAKAVKAAGGTVYTVGIFEGAEAQSPNAPGFNLPDYYDENTNGKPEHDHANCNRYMYLMSSDYPDATGMKDGETGDKNPHIPEGSGYYLSAHDSDNLNAIFDSISSHINAGPEADETTEIRDVLSPYFQLPEGENTTVTVKTAKAKSGAYSSPNNANSWESPVPFNPSNPYGVHIGQDPEGNAKVSVDGFDFMANFVSASGRSENDPEQSGSFYGRKLIIEFNIVPKTGFLGGNNVPTNGAASGVYAPGEEGGEPTCIGAFNVPTVDVPIPDLAIIAPDKNVYLYGTLTEAQLKAGATATAGEATLHLDAANYGLEPWQYEFVNITVEVGAGTGTVPVSPILPGGFEKDDFYGVTVTIAPKESGTAAQHPVTQIGHVHVFKPEITFKDEAVEEGSTVDLTDNDKIVWKHGATESSSVTMIGDEPQLVYSYRIDNSEVTNPAAYPVSFTVDQYVKVTVKIGGRGVPAKHVTFKHEHCSIIENCPLNDPNNASSGQFMLHLTDNNCTLTITKQAASGTVFTPGESFIFKITGANNFELEVVLTVGADGAVPPVTIDHLYAGEYTVTEDTGWSWRYTVEGGNSKQVTVTASSGAVTVENKLTNDKWLTWEAAVDNRWGKDGDDPVIIPHTKPEPTNP